jgi:hypothetical protein
MVERADRTYKRKTLVDPLDSSRSVQVPVLYKAAFVTAADQYQEQALYFNNSGESSRKTHVRRVTNDSDSGQYIDVERIDSFFVKSMAEQAQEYEWVIVNKDPPPKQPDGGDSPAHQKVHYVRYYQNNDNQSQSWIDVELIDELDVISAADQYQETHLIALHAEIGNPVDDADPFAPTEGFCDPSFDAAPFEDSLDPPYRLDPLQNVVNVHWREVTTAATRDVWMVINGVLLWDNAPLGFGSDNIWGDPAWLADVWHPSVRDFNLFVAFGPNDSVNAPAAFAFFDPLRTEFSTWTPGSPHGPPVPPRGTWYAQVVHP